MDNLDGLFGPRSVVHWTEVLAVNFSMRSGFAMVLKTLSTVPTSDENDSVFWCWQWRIYEKGQKFTSDSSSCDLKFQQWPIYDMGGGVYFHRQCMGCPGPYYLLHE